MDTAYAGRWGDAFDPPLAVSNNAIKFAYWIAEEMDKCWNVLDFAHPAHTLPAEAPDSSQAAAPAAAPAAEPVGIRATQRFERMLTNLRAKNVLDKDELETMFALSLSDVPKVATTLHAHAQVEGAPAEVYIALCKVVLKAENAWFQFNAAHTTKRQLTQVVGNRSCPGVLRVLDFGAGVFPVNSRVTWLLLSVHVRFDCACSRNVGVANCASFFAAAFSTVKSYIAKVRVRPVRPVRPVHARFGSAGSHGFRTGRWQGRQVSFYRRAVRLFGAHVHFVWHAWAIRDVMLPLGRRGSQYLVNLDDVFNGSTFPLCEAVIYSPFGHDAGAVLR
eukprot:s202_g17.t1